MQVNVKQHCPPRALGVGKFLLFFALFNTVLFQWPLYSFAISTRSKFDWSTIFSVSTLFVFQMMISMIVLGVCALISIRFLKMLCALLTVGNSIALYFIVQYNVIIDAAMIGNIVNTNLKEASELGHPKLLLYILVLGIVASDNPIAPTHCARLFRKARRDNRHYTRARVRLDLRERAKLAVD